MTTRPRIDVHDSGDDGSPPPPPVHDPVFEPLRDALRPVYQLLRRLGEGGMGAVYLAREPGLKRDVAVKVMLPWLARDETARARFDREAQAVAAIAHPNVINIFGTGELADGTPYFVMQFVRGRSLEERLGADGALGVREARRVLAEVAAALAAAHGRGIIHRDIKAANVLQDAESGRVVVTDFGIAAVRDQAEAPVNARLTQPDAGSPGTPAYMAPEQLLGEETTEASDVYAFGLLAYELLTGAGPFRATSPHEIAAAHLRDVPASLSQHRADVDPDLDHLVTSCLAKNPADRPTTASLVQRLPPGDALSLEWPPPGLEMLSGRLPRITRRIGLGSGLLAAAILSMLVVDPDSRTALPLWVLELLALGGGGLLLSGLFATQALLRAVRRALRRGYQWLPLLEVVADRSGDTGALISGLREYAALPRATRSRLRAGRLIAAAAAFGAAVAPLPTLLLVVRLGGAGALNPRTATLVEILPSLLFAIAAIAIRLHEWRTTQVRQRSSAKQAKRPEIARNVVTAWNESFEIARQGQSLGDRTPKPLVTRAVVGAVVLSAMVAAIATAPLAVMPVIGSIVMSGTAPKLSTSLARIRRGEAARAWRMPRDESISPTAAGQAYHALLFAGGAVPPHDMVAAATPIATSLLPAGRNNPLQGAVVELQDSLLRLGARRALSPAVTAWLMSIAANPGWEQFRRAARAPRFDLILTRYTRPTLDTSTFWQMNLPRYATLKDAGYAATAVAALRLAQGRREDAEAMLRDAAGIGVAMIEQGPLLIETLIGAAIATNALDRLETFYELTGRRDQVQRLHAVRDSARQAGDRMVDVEVGYAAQRAANPVAAYRQGLLRLVADSATPAGYRWEFSRYVRDMPCFSGREMVFGPAPEVDSALAMFQRQLVRSPGDSLWMRLMHRPLPGGNRLVLGTITRGFGAVLGSSRTRRCMDLMTGIF